MEASGGKRLAFAAVSAVLALLTVSLFVVGLWGTAADGQGAIAFYFLAPILGAGIAGALLCAWLAPPSRLARWAMRGSSGVALLLTVFYLGFFVPGLGFLSDAMVRAVAGVYEVVAGETPYATDKR